MSIAAPQPLWFPTERDIRESNIARLMLRLGIRTYEQFHRFSSEHREEFWGLVIREMGIRFATPPGRTLAQPCDRRHPDWLPGASMNIVDSCFSPLHPVDKPAILWASADGAVTRLSYFQLKDLTHRVARGLGQLGLKPGGRVAIDMPMRPEAVALMLGAIAAGYAVVSIADSFAAPEVAARMRIGGASVIFTQDVIHRAGKTLPLYEKVVAADPQAVVVVPARGEPAVTLRRADLWWNPFLAASGEFEPVHGPPDAHTNIIFSSGTTGEPKAIPWTHTTPIKCAADAFLHADVKPHDVLGWPTSMGWMMGPWLVYASLINGATMALYEDAPQTRGFAEFVSKVGVTMLGVVPSLVAHWRANNTLEGIDLQRIRRYASTGECSNPDDMAWLMARTPQPRPVIEYCGGTEIGGGYITSTLGRPIAPSTFTTPALGCDFVLLDESGHETDNGEVFLIPPSLGMSTQLLNADHDAIYYGSGLTRNGVPLRTHGDQIQRLAGGYYRALGRADDTMNLGGIKVSNVEIERVVASLPGVREAAAIAIPPPGGGPSRLVIYAVTDRPVAELKPAMQQAIRQQLNPLFHIHDVVRLESLPRTASNKIMRRELRTRYATTNASIDRG